MLGVRAKCFNALGAEAQALAAIQENLTLAETHAAGDAVLERIAHLLTAEVRDSDIMTRYGGEKFAICCLNTNWGAPSESRTDSGAGRSGALGALGRLTDVTLSLGVAIERNLSRYRGTPLPSRRAAL